MSLMEGSPLNRADLRAISVNTCRTCILLSSQPPDKLEPVLADKEIVMAALNIRSMSFGEGEAEAGDKKAGAGTNSVNILLDLSFVTNVRYLDQHEIHLRDNLQLQETLPFATGMAMARGILDSLMSATYFNASALRLLRLLVTGAVFSILRTINRYLTKEISCIIFRRCHNRAGEKPSGGSGTAGRSQLARAGGGEAEGPLGGNCTQRFNLEQVPFCFRYSLL